MWFVGWCDVYNKIVFSKVGCFLICQPIHELFSGCVIFISQLHFTVKSGYK